MKKKNRLSFERDMLRQPGQSVNDELQEVFDEKVESYIFFITAAIILVMTSWIQWIFGTHPIVMTVLGVGLVTYFVYKLYKIYPKIQNLKKGYRGELYVAQVLDDLRKDGYKVFHDIVGDGFNIDHVLIGPSGVYVVETKTWGNSAKITSASYDGTTLMLNGHPVPTDPLSQVYSEARWLSEQLHRSVGYDKRPYVQSIIALPSKFVDPSVNKVFEKENVRFLNPKTISSFVKKDKKRLSNEQVSQLAYHLERIVKSQN